ncbi:MAG: ATP-binding protein [Bacteroidales bacterium]|nr:ATP-binding protein [Bacteroidales bacterium]
MAEREDIKEVGFTVDSGLINRLGIELVGKAETAVSELIKNAYDADAKEVTVEFKNTDEKGGSLIISDTGLGMTKEQLIMGFMRISSTEKVHNPKSVRYGRTRAGKKGIGRFATQRLGEQLTIITQTLNSPNAVKITIDWNKYSIDTDIESITFPIIEIEKEKEEGTTLIINNLREKWSVSSIEKIFSYVNSLFQPDYLSDRSKESNIAVITESSFKFTFSKDGVTIKNIIEDFYDRALVEIEGYVGNNHEGIVAVNKINIRDNLDDVILPVTFKDNGNEITVFSVLKNVRFKAYYFIYDKPEYYNDNMTKKALDAIKNLANTASGIKLYRNGFRVLPFGEASDDWIKINQRWAIESGKTNIPFRTNNLFGFVELVDDSENNLFEETSSREGLIENEAYFQLIQFVYNAMKIARNNIKERILKLRKAKLSSDNGDITQYSEVKESTIKEVVDSIKTALNTEIETNQAYSKEEKDSKKQELSFKINQLYDLIDENEMLRVLAGLGLILGEFVHEIKQNKAAINSLIYSIQQRDESFFESINELKNCIQELFSYNNYFSTTISQNTNREIMPINLRTAVNGFKKMMEGDLKNNKIDLNVLFSDGLLETIPMHPSIWTTILQNLYSNSKKAIKRKYVEGKILIEVLEQKNKLILRFNDNGCGIEDNNKNRVFNAFYSTTTSDSFNATNEEQLIGTGLGLKIIKDLIVSNKGTIEVVNPTEGYATCFEIKIDKNQ